MNNEHRKSLVLKKKFSFEKKFSFLKNEFWEKPKGFDKRVFFVNNKIIAKGFEKKNVISVMSKISSTKLYARSPVLIKAWLRADRVLWITHRATEVSQSVSCRIEVL